MGWLVIGVPDPPPRDPYYQRSQIDVTIYDH